MGVWDKMRELWRESASSNEKSDPGQPSDSSTYGSTYKCAGCGKSLTGGPALYCDGCGQYYCYPCGVASGDMIWDCPNCAIQAHRVNL
ncbi:MAG: hypothetical protein KGH64_05485 [Candidatus Micrarchaeota archaeon]|nr:hypothetical protein [Nitrososphaerota archaeon]MDE1768469.1 hypothetical protein [Candidatus Micrarchaeota archaeon]MDE1834759.1 hypothetical protein [Candidatus Micrarchaeota archaeon]MDE1859758.1 hypothetical protein [Candidatus Micrarchaeota archaeon]